MITAVVLAAGTSRRMGRCKQLLCYKGQPLVRIASKAACDSKADHVLVVTGFESKKVELALQGLPLKTVYNPAFLSGQGSSLAAGIKAAPQDTSAFAILVADLPHITADTVNFILSEYEARGKPLALRPLHKGKPGHPVIVNAKLRPNLESLRGEEGARAIFRTLKEGVVCLETGDPGTVLDVDTPDEIGYFHSWPKYL